MNKIKDIMGKVSEWMGKNVLPTVIIILLIFSNLFTYGFYSSTRKDLSELEDKNKTEIEKKDTRIEVLEKDKQYYKDKVDDASPWFEMTEEEQEEIIKENERKEKERLEQEQKEREERERKEKEEQERLEKEQEKEEEEEHADSDDKVEQAKAYVKQLASEIFGGKFDYEVVVENDMVMLATYTTISQNDTMDDWNYLVESSKTASKNVQNAVNNKIGDVKVFLAVGSDYNHIYLMVGNGVVYYDTFNGIDLLGVGGINKGALQ